MLTSPRTLIAILLICWTGLATASPSLAQSSNDPKLSRAGAHFQSALKKREAAYQELLEEYKSCEDWVTGNGPIATPYPIEKYLSESAIPAGNRSSLNKRLLAEQSFAEFWNKSLYKLSRKATAFSVATRKLENSFHKLEKLRHPERYQRGSDHTPNGIALIAAGKYQFDPSEGNTLGHPTVQESRQVSLRQFFIDKLEVSNAEYARFLLAQPTALREDHLPAGWAWSDDGAPLIPDGQAAFPVTGVSWTSANSYATWIGKRLPTEDEWQAAAAGFSERRYPMGDRFDASKTNTQLLGHKTPRPTSEFSEDSTPQAVMCLTGNVREWTADLYSEPTNGKVKKLKEPNSLSLAVVKGGSFIDKPNKCQSNFRWLFPAIDSRIDYLGFRCAMDVN